MIWPCTALTEVGGVLQYLEVRESLEVVVGIAA